MFALLISILHVLRSRFEARTSREAEILFLRQQLLVLIRETRKRVRLWNLDRLVLVWMYRLFIRRMSRENPLWRGASSEGWRL